MIPSNNLEPNPILNTRPPVISKSEIHLPRPYRSALSQLRSNYCPKLKSYQHRIDPGNIPLPPALTAPCLITPPSTSSTALPTKQPSLTSTTGTILLMFQNSLQITPPSPTSPLFHLFLMSLILLLLIHFLLVPPLVDPPPPDPPPP